MHNRSAGESWVYLLTCIIFFLEIYTSVILDNFEIASLPTTSPEERKRLLSFVICGGGPTGVETAAVCLCSFQRTSIHLTRNSTKGNLRFLPRGYRALCEFI